MAQDVMQWGPYNPDQLVRPTYAEIDLAALRANLQCVRRAVQPNAGILAVVKSDAYGHGLVRSALVLAEAGAAWFGVARLEEAIELRQAGIDAPILLMAGILPCGYEWAARYSVTVGVIDWAMLEQIEAAAGRFTPQTRYTSPVEVHLKIDTGMHRLGIPYDEYIQRIDYLGKLKRVRVSGIFSHLANADNGEDDFVMQQARRFHEASERTIPYIKDGRLLRHLANSDGIFRDPSLHGDLVRPGIALYGYCRGAGSGLQPVLKLKSRIVQIKRVEAGGTVGYDRYWVAQRESRIGVVPIGYADGFSRAYTGGDVLVRGKVCRIIGRICMDMLMIDVTALAAASVGDEVVCIGKQQGAEASPYEWARLSGTSHYQVLTSIQSRVPRLYVEPSGRAA